ncbi:uncharacterized protein BDZ99DRAFT_525788 [Mytilinidion resinicola]|uniref:PSP1 C-terminal domain-containing protein n=1 Tax=Mytilinidion resinicola TaxID=574789 RepID=A0A6A6Y8Q2_9PEZI|nr:uncharacterized protein BDZ99DRAFT_525788 [Mytilinidion resinicola]KAF2804197.1 hypothetical protein BDZ99DRAFT_525788 [Mytilinidion resinicola]
MSTTWRKPELKEQMQLQFEEQNEPELEEDTGREVEEHTQPGDSELLAETTERAVTCSEAKAKRICQAKVAEHGLNMETLGVECQLGYKKLTSYDFADPCISLNELMTDLLRSTRLAMVAGRQSCPHIFKKADSEYRAHQTEIQPWIHSHSDPSNNTKPTKLYQSFLRNTFQRQAQPTTFHSMTPSLIHLYVDRSNCTTTLESATLLAQSPSCNADSLRPQQTSSLSWHSLPSDTPMTTASAPPSLKVSR